jgi:hypothetical protein
MNFEDVTGDQRSQSVSKNFQMLHEYQEMQWVLNSSTKLRKKSKRSGRTVSGDSPVQNKYRAMIVAQYDQLM